MLPDSLQLRMNTAAQVVVAILFTVGIIYQGFNTQLQMRMTSNLERMDSNLKEERNEWHEHVQREIDRDRQQQQRREAIQQQQLRGELTIP